MPAASISAAAPSPGARARTRGTPAPGAGGSAGTPGRYATADRARTPSRGCCGRSAGGCSGRRVRPADGSRTQYRRLPNTSLYIVEARMTTFRRLLGFLRPYRRDVVLSLVFAWAAMGMTVLIPFLVGQTVNAIERHDTGALLPLAGAILGAVLLRLGLTFVRRLVAGR